MARAPFNVLVVPFLRRPSNPTLYCVLRRADEGWWQWVAGGGEDGKSPAEAADRELFEETGLRGAVLALDSRARVPATAFAHQPTWVAGLTSIPEYQFAVETASLEITLSPEHTELRWAAFDEAHDLLRWASNQTALRELSRRITADSSSISRT